MECERDNFVSAMAMRAERTEEEMKKLSAHLGECAECKETFDFLNELWERMDLLAALVGQKMPDFSKRDIRRFKVEFRAQKNEGENNEG